METKKRRARAAQPAQNSGAQPKRGLLAGLALAATVALPFVLPGTAQADPASREAVAVRHLQSEMMVAALSCQMRGQYNAVVKRFERELIGHGQSLRAYFTQAYGNRAQRELDRYITALANSASSDRLAAGAGYCNQAARLFHEVLDLPAATLGGYSVSRFDPDGELLPRVESAAAR